MTATSVEVIKIGGSLVTRPDFVGALRAWLVELQRAQADRHFVLVVGGGPLVDVLRQFDAAHPMGDDFSHWKAIELMETVGTIIGSWLPELEVVADFRVARTRCHEPGITLLLATHFLREVEPQLPGNPLPAGWHVTSDSIAARVAIGLDATTLTLLKAAKADPHLLDADWQNAAEAGLVDSFFPRAVMGVPQVNWATLPEAGSVCSKSYS